MIHTSRRAFFVQSAAAAAAPLVAAQNAAPPEKIVDRKILIGNVTPEKLTSVLLPREKWKPFPMAADRAAWEALPSEARSALVESGARYLGAEWAPLPASLFLQYKRVGNRSNYERVRNTRRAQLRSLVMAECAEGKGRFLDDIANGVWTTCEETFWGVPAHLGSQKAGSGLPDAAEPIVDLFAAETSSLLAWSDYLLGAQLDKVSPLIRRRILLEMDRRIFTPMLEREDFSWMGLGRHLGRRVNNWNPWINSNWLTSVLLLEPDAKRRVAAVHKSMRSVDRFLDSYDEDGGCDEGPGYWGRAGASLFDCLELLHSASNGALDYYANPLVREIGRYIYRAHINGQWFLNFADATARLNVAGDLIFRYGKRIGDERMQSFGAWAAAGQESSESIGRQLPAVFNPAIRGATGKPPLLRDVWMPGVQVMAARVAEGSAEGLYLAAQGGHNAESHNHNDVGNFVVYAGGEPLIIDVGVETYTAKTFSSRRYEIWTMQSAYHNLPTIDGVMQAAGREFEARDVKYRATGEAVEFALNIAGAYPTEAGIQRWDRLLRLDRRKNAVEIRDAYSLSKAPGQITLTLMTPKKPEITGAGTLSLGSVKVLYDARQLAPKVEEIRIEDGRLKGAWGERLYRILLVAEKPKQADTFMVRIV